MGTTPKIGLILNDMAREAFEKVLTRAGYDVFSVTDSGILEMMVETDRMDAWIFDARDDESFNLLASCQKFLLPADNPPIPGTAKFDDWADGLVRQLDSAVGSPSENLKRVESAPDNDAWDQVASVWVLSGSTGGLQAMQEFLSAFQATPPAAFIVAQHFDGKMERQLESLRHASSALRVVVGNGHHYLRPGDVWIVPARCKMAFGALGEIRTDRSNWEGDLTPSISEVLIAFSAADIKAKGAIMFSGMGNDGADAVEVLDAAGAEIWAQEPKTCVASSMPEGAISSGRVSFVGTPSDLAIRFLARY